MAIQERSLAMVEGQQTPALSLIDGMNVAAIQSTMNKIAQFQNVVRGTLKERHDFGVIPGTQKPTLLKPGAEKILMLMGLTSEYEVIDKVQDYETGFFAFTIRCKLSRNGFLITEGVGHANTKEKRYQGAKQDPYTLANTVLKMGKKRALVDAALTVASLSDIFTQDIEDMDIAPADSQQSGQQRQQTRQTNEKPASDKQLNFLQKKAQERSLEGAALNAWVQEQVGKNIDELTSKEASQLIDAVGKYTPAPKGGNTRVVQPGEDPFADDSQTIDIDESDLPF